MRYLNQDFVRGSVAILAGSVVIFLGDTLLGAQIDIFFGIATFTPAWALDVFLVPFIAGLVVAMIYKERGGKWLAILPPLIVRCLNCFYLYHTNEDWNADFFYHLNLHYWGLCVILVVEAANIGGILGESRVGAYRRNKNKPGRTSQKEPETSKI